MERLANARNIIIVGYSLPRTDIYMQYFLKAAVGPNIDINRIYVFNPALEQNASGKVEMAERYRGCFAPQLQKKLVFAPKGSADDFVASLGDDPASILY